MATKVNVEGVLLLEQPFARVPYENYRKVFRTSQKYIEKDLAFVQSELNNANNNGSNATTPQDALKSIDGMIERVETLKRKLSDLHDNGGRQTLQVMRERFTHLADIENVETTSSTEYAQWTETRLDRWLVDWTLRHGKERSARQLAREKNIETLVDIDLFTDIRRIEDALSQHSCTEALTWCSENKAALRKMKSTLEFELRLQEYIELARARKSFDAISYAKKHLVQWQESHMSDILHASTLIAFHPNTTCLPYRRLYDPARWNALVQSFRLTAYNLNTLPTSPLLHLSLYAGLAALKSPLCFNPATKNVDCPVCDIDARVDPSSQGGLGKLAEQVPTSHHANSTIVCRITGKIMDEDNMPMAFPDGQVYSREALEEMAAKNDGMVTCPKTGTRCEFSALRKVFIS
ncbi:hypothetical protein M378DRAFT_105136 [Amanita muscaria Koide BX008]|uniref:Macrophage erythroblast attacher n=1 Tax=Amanita muscaria (strain Koide BX008) TaxID=946122 RepID=A0A0C2SQA1_AMAMK|nr:hypothetical protein M378DRAFT_105136 [Amanita muscaria Koide BX008]